MLKTLWKGTGNYKKEVSADETKYYYFGNRICVVNHTNMTFKLDACGWNGYSSTTRALNELQRYYKGLGYTLTERK